MVLWIDTNIILDVLEIRQPYFQDSSMIWKICETGLAKGYISTLSFANLVYILRKELSSEQVEDVLSKLSLIFNFADLKYEDINKASHMKWKDFEDAVQVCSASRIHADFIITRNIKDFENNLVSPIEPHVFLFRFWNHRYM